MSGEKANLLFAGDHLRAVSFGAARRAILTFDHREPGKAAFGPPRAVRRFLDQGWAVLRIMTRVNDWFINPDTEAMEAALAAHLAGFDEVRAIGFSMGGYGAFRFASALGITRVVAISPQVSISPEVVPWDTRFHDEAGEFDPALGDLAARPMPGLGGVIVTDPFHRHDLRNALEIAALFRNVRILRLGLAGHPAARPLMQTGRGHLVHDQVLADRPSTEALREGFRQARREMPDYRRKLVALARMHGHADLAARLAGATL
ncbi:MAG: alpha/beta hydrolase [Rhodobacteraceae bacterium]|nr:alpha/beta hydrolase [Paracoccaceae bacterium]